MPPRKRVKESNVVSIDRFKREKNNELQASDHAAEFLEDAENFVLIKFDGDERIKVMSSFVPSIREITLVNAAYLFMLSELEFTN
jgi:hypothetical protein